GEGIDRRQGVGTADFAGDLTTDLDVAVRIAGLPDQDGDLRIGDHRLVLRAVHFGVHEEVLVVGIDPNDVGGDVPAGEVHADRRVVLAGGQLAYLLIEHLPILRAEMEGMNQLNVLGSELELCSSDPVTGYYRTGCCENHGDDPGLHVVCAVMT